MDFVVSFRIALASDAVEILTRASNPDLYWAVLGGAPVVGGVILDYTLETIASDDYPNSRLFNCTFA